MICEGSGTPLKVITTAANVNDVTQTLALFNSIPPMAGHPGHPHRPKSVPSDKAYDSRVVWRELRHRRIMPVILPAPPVQAPAVRWEHRIELHDALVPLTVRM